MKTIDLAELRFRRHTLRATLTGEMDRETRALLEQDLAAVEAAMNELDHSARRHCDVGVKTCRSKNL